MKLQNNQYAINNDTERLYSQVSHLANITNRRIDVIWSSLAKQVASVNQTINAIHTPGLYVKYCPIARSPPKDPLLAIGQV